MSELTAVDGDGVVQPIWLQERGDTCGPASVYMIERILRQACLAGGEERVVFLESLLPNGYQEGKGTVAYTALAEVLGRVGIPSKALHVGNVAQFVAQTSFPFIARVEWTNGNGHFVVVVKTTKKGDLVCLDPWYGLVQPPIASLPNYNVQIDYREQICLVSAIGGRLSGHVVVPYASTS